MTMARKKLTLSIIDQEVGQALVGKFVARTERPWTDKATGEDKLLATLIFEDPKTGERFGLFENAGLRTAMEQSLVAPGDLVEIVRLEKVSLGGGKTVNQYDIYALAPASSQAKPVLGQHESLAAHKAVNAGVHPAHA